MEQVVNTLVEKCKSRINSEKNWDVATFIIEYYIQESGNGSCCLQIASNGEFYPINMSKLGMLEILKEIQDTTYTKWNKAVLTIYKDETHYFKTWWDTELQKSLYGTDA